jgi:hypothetical protein
LRIAERGQVGEQPRVESLAEEPLERRAPRARRSEGNCSEKAAGWRRLKSRQGWRKSGE